MTVSESIGRDLARLIIWYPFRYLIKFVPIKVGFRLIRWLGVIHFYFSKSKKEKIKKNFAEVFSHSFQLDSKNFNLLLNKFTKNYFIIHYINQLQILLFPKLTKNNFYKFHSFEKLEKLAQMFQRKQNCILLHAHFGPTQMPLHILGLLDFPVVQIGYPTDEGLSWIGKKVAFRLRCHYESKIKAKIINPTNLKFLRPLINELKEGKIILMTAGDGTGGKRELGKRVSFPFLGKKWLFPIGPFRLAKLAQAAVFPIFTFANPTFDYYRTVILEPIYVDENIQDKKNYDASFKKALSKFVSLFEDAVKKQAYLWHFWDKFPS